jgi:hypothetical protein
MLILRNHTKRVVISTLAAAALIALPLVGLTLMPTRVQSSSNKSIADAKNQLDKARAARKTNPSKTANRTVQSRLNDYNATVAARVIEIKSRIKELSSQVEPPASSSPVDSGPFIPNPGSEAALAELNTLRAELQQLTPNVVGGAPSVTNEVEPNNTPATSTGIPFLEQPCGVGQGSINPGGDLDYWSFQAPAGSKVWAFVDTGGTPAPTSTSDDSFLTLFDTNGTTVLETDDDDGTGTGCDSSAESILSSAIAGRTLTTGGVYFLQVRAFGAADIIGPYRLFVVVTTGVTAESEPNNSSLTANSIVTTAVPVGHRSGSISVAGDADFYSVQAAAGNVIYVNADCDPENNGGTDLVIDVIDTDGTSVLLEIDNSITAARAAETSCITAVSSGTYFVEVRHFSAAGTGTYELMVAACTGGQGGCPSSEFSATLGAGPGAVHGQQTGRLFRDGITSSCESPKACSIFTNTGLRTFDAWTFRNTGNTDACVRVDFQSNCGTANGIQSEAYLGNFDPNNICTNYLADFGFSLIFSNASYSFIVPAGATFTVVFNENDPGTGCPNYKFTLSGIPCFDICVQDDAGRGFIQISSFTGSYSFTRCVKPTYSLAGTGVLTTSGCKILLNDQGSGRNVSFVVNPCTAKGNGTVALTGKPTTAISDTNIFDNTCSCIP